MRTNATFRPSRSSDAIGRPCVRNTGTIKEEHGVCSATGVKTGVCKNYLLVFYLLLVNHLVRPRVVLAAQPHYMGYCVVIIKQEAQNHRADTTRLGQRKTTSEIGPWRTGAQQDINNWSPTHLILQTALRPGPQHETRGVEPINSIKNTRWQNDSKQTPVLCSETLLRAERRHMSSIRTSVVVLQGTQLRTSGGNINLEATLPD